MTDLNLDREFLTLLLNGNALNKDQAERALISVDEKMMSAIQVLPGNQAIGEITIVLAQLSNALDRVDELEAEVATLTEKASRYDDVSNALTQAMDIVQEPLEV